jgi:hypothetical protein
VLRAAAAGAVLTALLFAGCGGPGPVALRGNPQGVVRAAADRTLAMGTARIDVTLAVDTDGTGIDGTGVADLGAQTAQLSFERTGAEAHLDDHFNVVVSGGTDYVEALGGPAGEGGMPGTTAASPWLSGSPQRLAIDGHDRMAPLDALLVRPGAALDLAFLRGAVKVLPYGGEEMMGANTIRYSADIDLGQAIANSPPDQRPALEAALQAIGPVIWPVDVWLDDEGRVRHLEMAENPESHTTTTKGNILYFKDMGNPLPFTDIDFYDFGVPAKISVPNPDQVVEAR